MVVRVVPAAEPPVGEPVGHWSLRADPSSARLARRLVTRAMDGADEGLLRRAVLVTSELVSNGVRYGSGAMSVALHRVPDGWLITVADNSSAPPALHDLSPLAENGRGLLIVERVSEHVGWARTPTGKVVWAIFADDAR